MTWLHYLVEANIYLGVFYLCYCLFLNNETHYLWGRAYLLFSCVVSFILPVTQLGMLKPVEQPMLQQVIYAQPPVNTGPVPELTIAEPVKQITMDDVLFYAYIAGAVITLLVLFYRLYRLSLLTRKSETLYANKYKLIQLNGDNTAFSFFNYLFIGTEVPQADTIIAHELVHIRQRHSADILFVELIKVLSWFNPFIYLLQRSLRTLHEYIADEQTAARERDALTYSSFLLNNAYGIQGSPIAHSFFNYNLLKKRIIMLNQKRSGRLARLKYLAAVPLCVGMLCASTLVFSKDYAFIDLSPAKPVADTEALKTMKYFRIVDKKNKVTTYADNVSFTIKGISKTYLAKNTTAADIAYIEKTTKLSLEVINVDDKTYKPVPAAKADTAFAMRPPAKFGNGYTLQENGYIIDKKVPYITVTITDNSGNEKMYNSTTSTSAERKMLKDKYGFEFKKDKMMAFIKMASQSDKAFSNNPQLPPPPPPTVIKESFQLLAAYISQTIKYPKEALNKKTQGGLIVSFDVDGNGKISNIMPMGNPPGEYFKAVQQSISAYPGIIKDKAGTYKLGVDFHILGLKTVAFTPPSSTKNSYYIGKIAVRGIIAAQRKALKLPPPPPSSPAPTSKPPKVAVMPAPKIEVVHFPPPTVKPVKAAKPIPAPKVEVIHFPPPVVKPIAPEKADGSRSVPAAQSAVSAFSKELARTTRYPAKARREGIAGKVMLRFSVIDNKISNVLVMSGIDDAMDGEAKRALEDYKPQVGLKSGMYYVPVTFAIIKGDKPLPEQKPIKRSSELTLGPAKSLNEVVVASYYEGE